MRFFLYDRETRGTAIVSDNTEHVEAGLEVLSENGSTRAMMLTFFDKREKSNRQNGVVVHERGDLLNLLDSFRDCEPFFAELVGENGYKLTIGIGNLGCVQYSRGDDEPPYLMAIEPPIAVKPGKDQGFREFLVGDERTEVSAHFLLPFDRVKEIAAYFQRTGERNAAVFWEEI
jgi:hypothetical protein